MIGGLMKTSSRFAIIAAAGIIAGGVSSAQAGGLGGDCCADLEERVAELEATTVRKGNRKVSLKLSGQVNRSVLWWDDGVEDNTYSVDNSNTSTRFRLTGSVGVLPGLSAGYKIEMDAESARSGSVDQIDDDGGARGEGDGQLEVRVAEWYLKHDKYGKLTVGQGSPATDDLVKINLGGTAVATKDGLIMDTGGSFILRDSTIPGVAGLNTASFFGQAARWGDLAPGLDTARRDRVRYDSPTIAGFTLSAAWGEDDFWDAALRYAGEFGGIRVAAGIGYNEDHDEEIDTIAVAQPSRERTEYKGSASVWAPGALGVGPYLSASFVHREYEGNGDFTNPNSVAAIVPRQAGDFDFWRVEGGVRHNFIGLGDTSIYAEYAEADGGLESRLIGGNITCQSCAFADLEQINNSELQMWGIGIVQRIDAAAMELFVSYRNYEADVTGIDDGLGLVSMPLEDLTILHAGGRIRF